LHVPSLMLICYFICLIKFWWKVKKFTFIVEKLPLFCLNFKMIGHDLFSCRRLQHDANVISSGVNTVGTKIQQHYRLKVIDT